MTVYNECCWNKRGQYYDYNYTLIQLPCLPYGSPSFPAQSMEASSITLRLVSAEENDFGLRWILTRSWNATCWHSNTLQTSYFSITMATCTMGDTCEESTLAATEGMGYSVPVYKKMCVLENVIKYLIQLTKFITRTRNLPQKLSG